jgi:hypothetical protein
MKQSETKLIEAARELLEAYGYFVDNLWHVRDIQFICEQHNLLQITNEEALEVFQIANEQFEGDTGISWPKLEKALHTFLKRKTLLTMCEGNEAV